MANKFSHWLYFFCNFCFSKITYLSLPRSGDNPMITEAKADLTCWLGSTTKSLTHGRILVINTVSLISGDRLSQKSKQKTFLQDTLVWDETQMRNKEILSSFAVKKKRISIVNILYLQCYRNDCKIPFTFPADAARTSASQSLRSNWNATTRSFWVISGPTAFCNYTKDKKD